MFASSISAYKRYMKRTKVTDIDIRCIPTYFLNNNVFLDRTGSLECHARIPLKPCGGNHRDYEGT